MECPRAAPAGPQGGREAPAPFGARDRQGYLLCPAQWLCLAAVAARSAALEDGGSRLSPVAVAGPLGEASPSAACSRRVKAGRAPQPSAAIIASQSVKTSVVGGPRGYDGGKQVNGRKRHLLVDTQGLIMRASVHPANIADRDGAKRLLAPLQGQAPGLQHIWADSAYSGQVREWIQATLAYNALQRRLTHLLPQVGFR
jgi:hypothetical protein